MKKTLINLAENGRLPDPLIELGIRRLLRGRLQMEHAGQPEQVEATKQRLISELSEGPVAIATDDANEQHYELPPCYFEAVLGPRLKYSCALYEDGTDDLAGAEDAMLELSCARAELHSGQDILELGCGWGSLTLWMAEHYPDSHITAVSNSRPQREFILGRARENGLENVDVITADMNTFDPGARQFDRVVSVEMFEHMRNYQELLHRVAGWLKDDGKLFVHIFTHREVAYPFEVGEGEDWMAKYFFTGGMMPSHDLLGRFRDDLVVEADWKVNGVHYGRTLRDWLMLHDAAKPQVMETFREVYGDDAHRWFHRWRLFYLACAELFEYEGGTEWAVSHYRFAKAER